MEVARDVAGERVFRWPIRVYYEDTDATGIVYHASYLKYFERARTEWLRCIGFGQERLRGELGLAFTMASAQFQWKRPARLDDKLEVSVRVAGYGKVKIDFEQRILRIEDDVELITATVRIGCIDTTSMRPRRMPAAMTMEIANVS